MANQEANAPSLALSKQDIKIQRSVAITLQGMICLETGKVNEAIRLFEEAIEIEPNNEIATCCLGICKCKIVILAPDLNFTERENYLNQATSNFHRLSELIQMRLNDARTFCDKTLPLSP